MKVDIYNFLRDSMRKVCATESWDGRRSLNGGILQSL